MSIEMDSDPLFLEENEEEEYSEVGVDDDDLFLDDDDINNKEDVYSCKYCAFTTSDLDYLDEHIVSHDEAVLEDEEFEDDPEGENSVSSGTKTFPESKGSADYNNLSNDGGRITRKGYQRFPAFFDEMKNNPVKKVFVCPYCGYQSMKKLDMNGHLKQHSSPVDMPIYACSECNYTTRRKCDMPKHLLSHCKNGSVPMYKCDYCPYATKRKGDLTKHLICHANSKIGEQEFYCLQCDYTSKRKGDLRKHMVSHDSLGREYNCTECGYVAKRLNDLHKHVILHRDRDTTLNHILKCLKCDYCTTNNNEFAKHVLGKCHSHTVISTEEPVLTSDPDYIVLKEDDLPIYELDKNDMTLEASPNQAADIRRSTRKRKRLNDDDFVEVQELGSYYIQNSQLLSEVGQERNKVVVLDG